LKPKHEESVSHKLVTNSAKLSHFVGRVPDLAPSPLPLLYKFDYVLEADLAPESLWVLSANS